MSSAPDAAATRRIDSATPPLLRQIADRLITTDADRRRLLRSSAQYTEAGQTDYFFATDAAQSDPDHIFSQLRWGGLLIFASPREREVSALLDRYRARQEYVIEREPETVETPRFPSLPFFRRRQTFFVARKVMITRVGESTDRYSYDVRLARSSNGDGSNGYIVRKKVPTQEQVIERLIARFPGNQSGVVANTARKLTEKVFPVFLTREAALLKILQRDLPESFRDRFPSCLHIEKDDRGLVRQLELNWLRQGGDQMSQIEFARQALEMLAVLHDAVGMIHLDLRLDNMVITPRGVSFVDFGSGVRIGEDLSANPMLATLFSELLSTSQIQQDLRRLVKRKKVTSHLFVDCCHKQKIDKAVDLFYLVLQMNNPHANPDFKGLVHYDRRGEEARRLSRLSRRILDPQDPQRDQHVSAAQVLRSIEALA